MKVSSTGSTPGGRPSSMPGMNVPEKPVTAVEPGWMIVVSCACACVANHRPAPSASMALLAVKVPRNVEIPLSRRIRLLPLKLGKAAGTRAPERASRAIPALSPLAIRCPPLAPAKIRRAFRCVNGIGLEPSRSKSPWRFDSCPASIDPVGPQHIVSMVMGCSSCKAPQQCGASAFSRRPARKGSSARRIRRFSPAAASASLRTSGFSREPFADPARPSDRSRRLQRP